MKKILTAIVLFALVVLPMSVMAMTSITEDELSTVTGQSGVSIGADLTMNLSLGTVAWGDLDGLAVNGEAGHDGAGVNGGWVGIKDLNLQNLRIHMRTDPGMVDVGTAFGYYTGMLGQPAVAIPTFIGMLSTDPQAAAAAFLSIIAREQLLTIDIYTSNGTTGLDGRTYVRIGLPTFEINIGDLTLDVGMWTNRIAPASLPTDPLPNTPGTWQGLGQVYLGGTQVLLARDNYVDITQSTAYGPATTNGVLIHIANKGGATAKMLDLNFTAASWGDLDGLSAFPGGAGFVGVKGMNLAIGMNMWVDINVGTATGLGITTPVLGLVAQVNALADMAAFDLLHEDLIVKLDSNDAGLKDSLAYLLHAVGTISATSVDIALQGTLNVSQIATQVVLADNKALLGSYMGATFDPLVPLSGKAGILGNLYISGVNLTIPTYEAGVSAASWVSISAH